MGANHTRTSHYDSLLKCSQQNIFWGQNITDIVLRWPSQSRGVVKQHGAFTIVATMDLAHQWRPVEYHRLKQDIGMFHPQGPVFRACKAFSFTADHRQAVCVVSLRQRHEEASCYTSDSIKQHGPLMIVDLGADGGQRVSPNEAKHLHEHLP